VGRAVWWFNIPAIRVEVGREGRPVRRTERREENNAHEANGRIHSWILRATTIIVASGLIAAAPGASTQASSPSREHGHPVDGQHQR
jgi:hypothetical protein